MKHLPHHPPSTMTRARRGFTMVEILIAIGIMAVLAGLIFAAFRGIFERQKVGNAVADIEQIRAGLAAYERAWGRYPPSDLFAGQINGPNRSLVVCLTAKGLDADGNVLPPTDPRVGPFLKEYILRQGVRLRPDESGGLVWLDPWDDPYVYFDRNALREYNGDEPTYRLLGHAEDENGTVVRPRKDETGVFYGANSFQVWSCGPNKRTTLTGVDEDHGPVHKRPGQDDITSWNEEGR